jgi:tryptophan halogenase
VPQAYDPLVDLMDLARLREHFSRVHDSISRAVAAMPGHGPYIARLTEGK